MKTTNIKNKHFNFWKENKIDGHFKLSEQELINEFQQWLPKKDLAWHNYYGIQEAVGLFIADHLNSVGNTENDFKEYREMEELLKPIRRRYIDRLEDRIEERKNS